MRWDCRLTRFLYKTAFLPMAAISMSRLIDGGVGYSVAGWASRPDGQVPSMTDRVVRDDVRRWRRALVVVIFRRGKFDNPQ